MPAVVYKFENQNISTFEDNVQFMTELPFEIYFDLETTNGKEVYIFDDIAKMYPVSYAFVAAFYSKLNLDKICVVRSFNHTLEMLSDISHFSNEMIKHFDPVTAKQIRECAENLHKMKEKYSMIEISSCEFKITLGICKKWFDEKFTRKNMELDLFTN